jgi:hypothetical protein
MTIEVLAIGTEVRVDREIPATIRGITIYSEHWVKYLVIWWDERKRHEEWLTADEFQVKTEPTRKFQIKSR